MQFSLLSLSALVGFTSAHLIMDWPPQWGGVPRSSPLEPDGSNFPCQGAVPDIEPTATLTANSTSQLQITGSAAHGGGSGQIAYTLDFPPTKNSTWYVGYTWEGNHPFKVEGNYPADASMPHDPIPFFVPAELPEGKVVFSWNWYNRVGNREHYMKCATVLIKSFHKDHTRITSLPTAFRADSGNGCTVPENTDAIKFKNPGEHVVVADGVVPTPIDCDPSKPGNNSTMVSKPYPPSTLTYGSTTEGSAAGSDKAPPPNLHSKLKYGDNNKSDPPSAPPAKPYRKPVQSYTPPPETGPECVEGTVTCNPDGTWSQCGSGRNQLQGKVTPGMVCKDGIFGAAKAKRWIRFSELHKRHRH